MKISRRANIGQSRVASPPSLSQIPREAVNDPALPAGTFPAYLRNCQELFNFDNWKGRDICETSDNHFIDKKHELMFLKWAEDNLKIIFSKVSFMDGSGTNFDTPDGWSKGLVVNGQDRLQHLRRLRG